METMVSYTCLPARNNVDSLLPTSNERMALSLCMRVPPYRLVKTDAARAWQSVTPYLQK